MMSETDPQKHFSTKKLGSRRGHAQCTTPSKPNTTLFPAYGRQKTCDVRVQTLHAAPPAFSDKHQLRVSLHTDGDSVCGPCSLVLALNEFHHFILHQSQWISSRVASILSDRPTILHLCLSDPTSCLGVLKTICQLALHHFSTSLSSLCIHLSTSTSSLFINISTPISSLCLKFSTLMSSSSWINQLDRLLNGMLVNGCWQWRTGTRSNYDRAKGGVF